MHSANSLNHLFLFHKQWNPEVLEYYFFQVISKIAHTLAAVFMPIYFYVDLQYSLYQIALIWVINQAFFSIGLPFAGKLIEKIGVKHTIALHIPFMLIFWYSLRFLTSGFYANLLFLILMFGIRAIPKAIKEASETVFIAKNMFHKNDYGTSLAKIRIVLILAAILSPLFGGAVIYFFGFDMLFNAAMLLLFLSAIPFFLTKDKHFRVDFKAAETWNFALHKLPKNFRHAEFGRGMANSAVWLLWPLFIYIIVKNTLDLGIMITACGFVSMIIAYCIGKHIDKKESKQLLKKSVKIATGIFYFRTLFASPVLIALTDIANRVFEPVFMVPYEKYIYKYINSFKDIVEISIAKNIISELGYLSGFFIITIIFWAAQFIGFSESSYFVFLSIFLLLGLFILLMGKITDVSTKG